MLAGTDDSVVVGTDDNVAVVPPVVAAVLVAPKVLLSVDVGGIEKPAVRAPVEIDG